MSRTSRRIDPAFHGVVPDYRPDRIEPPRGTSQRGGNSPSSIRPSRNSTRKG
jgi:hypothetical protein